jgi:hypothetical protein
MDGDALSLKFWCNVQVQQLLNRSAAKSSDGAVDYNQDRLLRSVPRASPDGTLTARLEAFDVCR